MEPRALTEADMKQRCSYGEEKNQHFTPVARYSLLLRELNGSTERPDVKEDALGDVPWRRPSQRDANQL